MPNNSNELKTYSFKQEDIDFITFSLRQLKNNSAFKSIKDDASELIKYIERLNKEKTK